MKIAKEVQRRAVEVQIDDLVIGAAWNYVFTPISPDNRRQALVWDMARVTLSAPSSGGLIWKVSGGVPLTAPLMPLTNNVDFAFGVIAPGSGGPGVNVPYQQIQTADIRPDAPLYVSGGDLLLTVEKTAAMAAGLVCAVEVWYRAAELTDSELLAISLGSYGGNSG